MWVGGGRGARMMYDMGRRRRIDPLRGLVLLWWEIPDTADWNRKWHNWRLVEQVGSELIFIPPPNISVRFLSMV